MSGLLDVLQGASNTAASNVSGPVDLIAWALRKAGVPVPQNALLSSQWMAEKGLLAQPKNKLAGMAGETLGLLAPVAAAAKAPQIAKGLLDHAEGFQRYNQALGPVGASHMVSKQPPVKWYHASPNTFDVFDLQRFGSGGFQNFADGRLIDTFDQALYATTSKQHAKNYGEVIYELTPKSALKVERKNALTELRQWAKENGFRSPQQMIDEYYRRSAYDAYELDRQIDFLFKSAKKNGRMGAVLDFGNLIDNGSPVGKVGAFSDPSAFDWKRLD